jgi:hypothetical protein
MYKVNCRNVSNEELDNLYSSPNIINQTEEDEVSRICKWGMGMWKMWSKF